MSLHVGTGKAAAAEGLLEAMTRGRNDYQFFSSYFLRRRLHDRQLEFCENSHATVNVLATSNRWGKTTVFSTIYAHGNVYKTGAENRYVDEAGVVDLDAFVRTKYESVHTAGEWEQAAFVWEDFHKLLIENEDRLKPFVKEAPKSLPPHVRFLNGAKWMFRTLGNNASGVDGKSIYILGIDEAGWIDRLEEMTQNVLRIRVADVRGRIIFAGTMKPGISRDFFKVATRASAYTGRAITFAHGGDVEEIASGQVLDSQIRKYLAEFGIDLDEYADALTRGAR